MILHTGPGPPAAAARPLGGTMGQAACCKIGSLEHLERIERVMHSAAERRQLPARLQDAPQAGEDHHGLELGGRLEVNPPARQHGRRAVGGARACGRLDHADGEGDFLIGVQLALAAYVLDEEEALPFGVTLVSEQRAVRGDFGRSFAQDEFPRFFELKPSRSPTRKGALTSFLEPTMKQPVLIARDHRRVLSRIGSF